MPNIAELAVEYRPVAGLVPYARNARKHSKAQVQALAKSIDQFGFNNPVLVDGDAGIIAGHGRVLAAKKLGLATLPVIELAHLSDDERRAYILADNRLAELATWDGELLTAELRDLEDLAVDLKPFGFADGELAEVLNGAAVPPRSGSLAERFGVPPFSVLNARDGWWQDRKRAWVALGIQGELGRGDVQSSLGNARSRQRAAVTGNDEAEAEAWASSSIFDPVLAELAYQWFCPPGGHVLDPFAGGSVRGIVAAKLGMKYTGVDLRAEQCAANVEQRRQIIGKRNKNPAWIVGDGRDIGTSCADVDADFIFTCPPYADLEVYSDDPADISTMDYEEFLEAYRAIIAAAATRLKQDRFAAIVVGDVRDKAGNYRGFPAHTIQAFKDAGLELYNEAVLVTMVGSLAMRTPHVFQRSRKMGKSHQNLLVFVKGDGRAAADAIGPVEFDGDAVAVAPEPLPDNTPDLTPVEQVGDMWAKRDDLFVVAGAPGGKARTCWALAQGAAGLVTAGSRASPQVNIVAHIAQRLGIPCHAHTPTGTLSPEVQAAQDAGAEIVQHRPGHNSVIIARARQDAAERGWAEIPFGMECEEAVTQTRQQVANLPDQIRRIVIPVGSGMSLAGVLWGLADRGLDVPVVGVQVGADPDKRLAKYAPPDWEDRVTLVMASTDYHKAVEAKVGDIVLDPHYEAKCAEHLLPGDLFWLVGIRATDAGRG